MPGVRTTRTTPVPSARTPAAIGGRFGPEAHDVLAGVQDPHRPAVLVGEPAGDGADLAGDLAAERAAVGERRRRLTARLAPRRVGLEVARLDPRRLQRAVPVARRHVDRPRQRRRRAPALARGRRGGGPRPASRPPPTRRRRPDRDQRVGRRGVVGEAAVTARPRRRRAAGVRPRASARAAPAASVGIGGPGRVERQRRPRRSAASRCSGRGGRPAPGATAAGERRAAGAARRRA